MYEDRLGDKDVSDDGNHQLAAPVRGSNNRGKD